MAKDELARGQLSTVILMTLLERDKYGYEIIDEVLKTTQGKVSIKQPSLYSSLKRMEDQNIISSYWRDSDIGGRRHYYHLTDLGKKHLEKWQQDLPSDFLSSNNTQDVKVVHQENLFNLQQTSKPAQPAEPIEVKDNSFVQYDLFSNSTIITPVSDNFEQANNEPIVSNNLEQSPKPSAQPTVMQNPILTTYEKPIESKSTAFEYVKKTNKSFSDVLKNDVGYEKKYVSVEQNSQNKLTNVANEMQIQEQTHNNLQAQENSINNPQVQEYVNNNTQVQENVGNYSQAQEQTINNVQEQEENVALTTPQINQCTTAVEFNDNIINEPIASVKFDEVNQVKQEQPQEETPNTVQHKDDAVFITDRINIEDMPKPTKWDTHRFETYISANNVMPDLKRTKTANYEDRVKELYEQSMSNAENKQLELIDNKIKFATYKDLQEFYKQQNIKFKPFNKLLKSSQKDVNMVKSSKLNMLSSLCVLIYVAIVSAVFGFCFSGAVGVKLNSPITYLIFPIITLVYFLIAFISYIKAPQKRIALDLSVYKFRLKYLMISLLFIPIIFAINLLFGFSFEQFNLWIVALVYPCCMTLVYVVKHVSRKILLKSKSMY